MSIQVGILYSDWTQVWKFISDIDDLRKDGVLTITITSERGNKSSICARMWSLRNDKRFSGAWWGDDKYAIGVLSDSFFTMQWADEDEFFHTRLIEDGSISDKIPRIQTFPPEADVTIFTGAYLEPPEWKKALKIFKNEMF